MARRFEKEVRFSGSLLLALLALSVVVTASPAQAEEQYASKERSAAALGHYARARTLLVEALREFEAGQTIARPDMLIDTEEWRLSVVSRTEELNRILDPKPRITRSGVRFQASPILVRREKNALPPATDEARSSNTFGEEMRTAEKSAKRARLASAPITTSAQPEKSVVVSPATNDQTQASDKHGEKLKQEIIDEITNNEEPAVDLKNESAAKQLMPEDNSKDSEAVTDNPDSSKYMDEVEKAIQQKMEQFKETEKEAK